MSKDIGYKCSPPFISTPETIDYTTYYFMSHFCYNVSVCIYNSDFEIKVPEKSHSLVQPRSF